MVVVGLGPVWVAVGVVELGFGRRKCWSGGGSGGGGGGGGGAVGLGCRVNSVGHFGER